MNTVQQAIFCLLHADGGPHGLSRGDWGPFWSLRVEVIFLRYCVSAYYPRSRHLVEDRNHHSRLCGAFAHGAPSRMQVASITMNSFFPSTSFCLIPQLLFVPCYFSFCFRLIFKFPLLLLDSTGLLFGLPRFPVLNHF